MTFCSPEVNILAGAVKNGIIKLTKKTYVRQIKEVKNMKSRFSNKMQKTVASLKKKQVRQEQRFALHEPAGESNGADQKQVGRRSQQWRELTEPDSLCPSQP